MILIELSGWETIFSLSKLKLLDKSGSHSCQSLNKLALGTYPKVGKKLEKYANPILWEETFFHALCYLLCKMGDIDCKLADWQIEHPIFFLAFSDILLNRLRVECKGQYLSQMNARTWCCPCLNPNGLRLALAPLSWLTLVLSSSWTWLGVASRQWLPGWDRSLIYLNRSTSQIVSQKQTSLAVKQPEFCPHPDSEEQPRPWRPDSLPESHRSHLEAAARRDLCLALDSGWSK